LSPRSGKASEREENLRGILRKSIKSPFRSVWGWTAFVHNRIRYSARPERVFAGQTGTTERGLRKGDSGSLAMEGVAPRRLTWKNSNLRGIGKRRSSSGRGIKREDERKKGAGCGRDLFPYPTWRWRLSRGEWAIVRDDNYRKKRECKGAAG